MTDLRSGAGRFAFWTALAWNDLQRQYRRSTLGPAWAAITFGIFVAVLGLLYSRLFGEDLATYALHLVLGMLVWNFLSNTLVNGCRVFSESGNLIKEIHIPKSVFVFSLITRNLIVLAYQTSVLFVVLILFQFQPTVVWLLAIPGLVLVLVNALWAAFLVGLIATRFRDTIEIIGSSLRILFLATPIIWMPGSSQRFPPWITEFNPFFHLIELVRAPITGSPPTLQTVLFAVALAIVGCFITFVLFGRNGDRIPFWI